MEAYEAIAVRLKESVNAAKKDAQKELGAWQNRRQGPRWNILQKEVWPRWLLTQQRIGRLRAELEAAKDPTEDLAESGGTRGNGVAQACHTGFSTADAVLA